MMGPIIMSFDMIEEGRGLEGVIVPVQPLHPAVAKVDSTECEVEYVYAPVDSRITTADSTDIAFEMSDIHRVEANLGQD
jgi:hypothetical protein